MSLLSPADPVDLTNCDREPIHQLGAIQPIGFLIALSPEWQISRVSANIDLFIATTAEQAIGTPIVDLFTVDAIHALRNRLSLLRGEDALERIFGMALAADGRRFDVALHMSGGCVIVEGEPTTEQLSGDATGTVRGMIARLDQAGDFDTFFAEGSRQVRALTGFDRVMIYRFDPDGSGHVVGESARSGIGSFLDLHYPASDIPRQARELYRRSLLRVIVDVDAVAVPVLPTVDGRGRPLDLSLSVLRSVSPIHLEYLRNMGVRASMSISILVEGELWGLIACHHYAPRCTSFERRSVAELFAGMFAMRIESRERKMLVDYERRARDIADQLLGVATSEQMLLDDPEWLATIVTQAIPADGVGVWIDGSYAFSGLAPDPAGFALIIAALLDAPAGQVLATERISGLVPQAVSHARHAAGMLAIPLSRSPRDFVVLFRAEVVRTVRWGGDPQKPVDHGVNGPRLTPRKSFEEWKELVEGSALPFTASEIRVAETLRATLTEVVLRQADEASMRLSPSSQRQDLMVAELNHRVRNILSVIRGLIRQSKPDAGTSLEDYVRLIDGRIHALARAHNQITNDYWGPAPLRALIEAEVAAFLNADAAKISLDGSPILLNPQAYSAMALVIHELVTNSAKYGALSGPGTVAIDWSRSADGDLIVNWRESGGIEIQTPTRRGFGTTIIEQSVPYDLGGEASIDYYPAGVEARFRIPARHVTEVRDNRRPKVALEPPGGTTPDPREDQLLAGFRVMLVEDSLIIALDAEDLLRDLGAREVLIDATVPGAIAAMKEAVPDLAILDINLGHDDSMAIADWLDDAGVPFMFATGYGDQASLPERHSNRRVLEKPYTLQSMARALPHLVEQSKTRAL
jgi:light-regulated signal transduction histidine kinase (bacteriophytochrome)/CheY-like chemotaxis protein